MKLLALLILLPTLTFGQYKYKSAYRPSPKKGEVIALAGLGMIAMTATGLMHNKHTDPRLARAVGMVGGSMICAGVVVDMGKVTRRRRK